MTHGPPTADPFRDTDVIDARAPRFAQGVTGLVALTGALFAWPLAWALMAVQLLMGIALGRQWCLPCLAYFKLVQPRFGEGSLEDVRPPRFANEIGLVFLSSASTTWWLGAETAGTVLASIVAALALLASTTGICVGCELYRVRARIRGISTRHYSHIDPADLGLAYGRAETYAVFTHPLCSDCREWELRLLAEGQTVVKVDLKKRPELARKYGVSVVPTVVSLAPDGSVLKLLAP